MTLAKEIRNRVLELKEGTVVTLARDHEIRGRFFDPFLIKGLKYPVRDKSH